MGLPLFDPIEIPPETTLVDVNTIEDDDERQQYQALALELWVEEENGGDWNLDPREWSDNEGIFVVEEDGEAIGVAIVLDVEAL